MTIVALTARGGAAVVDAEGLAPDRLAGSEREIARTLVRVGARKLELGELFSVSARAGDGDAGRELRVEPGGTLLDGLGAGMREGTLVVEGDAGDRVGAGMAGGEIRVHGRAGDWAGAGMAGGVLRVEGDAGFRAGGALAGAPRGMTGGVLLVRGSVGDEVGAVMRRGIVAAGGSAGARAGFHAIAGTVLVLGDVGATPAMATKRGSVVVFGAAEPPPGFRYACDYDPVILRLYVRHLAGSLGFPIPQRFFGGVYRRFVGDFSQLGKGEILLWRQT
ncbi:MAG TPA: formylmethanofuran dehydrogenase subunit C [Gemmatimonadota bacterium]|jgi:formylmethanofuran dehydrogenase subunit C